mmetsp:Transcript_33238/g.48833  ORF Transcript_33238/g.48833 Transcript_33238/m.48833 type:complete len:578 (-) Transcript_33238:870-2603(-)
MARKKKGLRFNHDKNDKQAIIAAISQITRKDCFDIRNAASSALLNDKEVVLASVSTNGLNLEHISPGLRADREVVSLAVISNWQALQYCSEELRADFNIVKAAVEKDGRALQFGSMELRADREMVTAAVTKHGQALRYGSDQLKGDREIVKAAVKNDGLALKFCSSESQLNDDGEIVRLAVENCGGALEYVSERFQNDKQTVLTALRVSYGGQEQTASDSSYAFCSKLRHASEELKADREVVLTAIRYCGGLSLRYVPISSNEVIADRDVISAAVQSDGSALEYAAPQLRADRDIVWKAIKQNGMALAFASRAHQGDREIVMAALKQINRPIFCGALQYCSSELQGDKAFVLEAFTLVGGFNLQFVSPLLKGDREVVESALQYRLHIRSSAILSYASEELRGDRQLVRGAIAEDSKMLFIASEEIQMDPDIVSLAWDFREDHDFDLYFDFKESDLRRRYIQQVVKLHKDMVSRNKAQYLNLDDPDSTVFFAGGWQAESLEKKWMTGEVLKLKEIPEDLRSCLIAFIGIEEDINVASKVIRFGSVLCQMKKGILEFEDDGFDENVWSNFVRDAREATS